MANQQQFVKIATPVRTYKSDTAQLKISLYNDQISFSFQPASGQKTEYGTVKYNGSPNVSPNVRFSIGVAAGIAKLLKDQVVKAADEPNKVNSHWEVYARKQKTYEAWVTFDTNDGLITMTGIEVTNGMRKQASYTFHPTIITQGQNQININGEALSVAELLVEIGGANEMPTHMRQYNQALKDNFPNAGQQMPNNGMMNQPTSGSQFMNNWHPN